MYHGQARAVTGRLINLTFGSQTRCSDLRLFLAGGKTKRPEDNTAIFACCRPGPSATADVAEELYWENMHLYIYVRVCLCVRVCVGLCQCANDNMVCRH